MRAFVAVDAPGMPAIAQFQRNLLSVANWDAREVKPVNAENFHFTLMFLGQVIEQESVIEKLSKIKFSAFKITLQGVGGFPTIKSARVIWIGVDSEGGKSLNALSDVVTLKMKELGFVRDKPFSPHLTIVRARDRPIAAASVSVLKNEIACGIVDRLHLKRSELSPSGPTYSNVYSLPAVN